MFGHILALILILVAIPFTASEDEKRVESVGAFADQSASESVRTALEQKGYRIVLGNSPLCDIWLRSGVPTRQKVDELGANYTELAESTLVGVISFLRASTDYRGQAIKPGAYTMRYGLLPNDGNHLGAAPSRDFLLLIPVAADKNVDAQFKFEELVKLSKMASGTGHPAPLSLVYPEGQKDAPTLIENDQGHVVFVTKVKTRSGSEMPLWLVVKGVTDH